MAVGHALLPSQYVIETSIGREEAGILDPKPMVPSPATPMPPLGGYPGMEGRVFDNLSPEIPPEVSKLSPMEQRVWYRSQVEGMPAREISKVEGLAPSVVRRSLVKFKSLGLYIPSDMDIVPFR